MNKLALAAIGVTSVAANPVPNLVGGDNHDYSLKNYKEEDSHYLIGGGDHDYAWKESILQTGEFNGTVFFRKLIHGFINSGVKGFYHVDSSLIPIPDECFGEWMDADYTKLNDIYAKFKDDPWSVTLEDAIDTSKTAMDMYYKNVESCKFQKIWDDHEHWCIDNPKLCWGLDGIVQRVTNKFPAITSKALDIYDAFKIDATTDDEIISQTSRWSEDAFAIISYVRGFNVQWAPSSNETHIKWSNYKKQKEELIEQLNINVWDNLKLPTIPELWDVVKTLPIPDLETIVELLQKLGLF